MQKNEYRIVKRVLNEGFSYALKSSEYSHNELLGLLFNVRKELSNMENKKIKSIIAQNLSCVDLEADSIGVISDTHIGSKFQNFEYIKRAYDVFDKHGIHEVFHLGDLFEGYRAQLREARKPYTYYLKQLEEFRKYYPKGFTTYGILGNHDQSYLDLGLTLEEEIQRRRKNFLALGYGNCYITNKNRLLSLRHKLRYYQGLNIIPGDRNVDLLLMGHSHSYYCDVIKNVIKVPTCSDNFPNGIHEKKSIPGFLILTFLSQEILLRYFAFNNYRPEEVMVRSLYLK